jgi:hypothetical protein
MTRAQRPDPQAVFLNVAYDRQYEPIFVALVAALLALGRKPRCILQILDSGEGRPKRIFRLLEGCAVSLHDLSRVHPPVRFNMPFELGMALALRRYRTVDGRHDVDPVRWHADLEDRSRSGQVGCRELVQRRAVLTQRLVHTRRVPRIGFRPHVEVLGEARLCVEGDRVPADQEVPSVGRVQRGK